MALRQVRRDRIEGIPQGRSALGRVGRSSLERARWLLSFALRNLDAPKKREAERLGWELCAYVDVKLPRDRLVVQPIVTDEMRKCQMWLREGLLALKTTGRWEFRVELPSRHILRIDPPAFYLVSGLSLGLLPFKQVVASDTAAVLAERLRFCARAACGSPFIRYRGQRYCSTKCSQAVRSERFRTQHPDYRHTRYEAKVRARVGSAKVKIRRRTPRPVVASPTDA
jgi:hypothetical protein